MKQRLLREAVTDNVDLIQGRRRPRPDRRADPMRLPLILLLVALPPIVFVSLRVAGVDAGSLLAQQVGLSAWRVPQIVASGSDEPDRIIHHTPPEAIDPEIFPLVVRKIVIDPGHGGDQPGTRTPSGILEKDIVLDIGLKLRKLLLEAGLEVEMTREDDVAVSLEERVRLANEREGDLFVSIHINWITARNVRGVETYYLGPTEDPYLEQLARNENQDSGYSLADFRRLLQGVYENVREDASRELARAIQLENYRALRQVNPSVKNRGVKTAPFVVLIGTEMPAVLAEVSCLSNRDEAELLQKPRYRQYLAESLARGILKYVETREPERPPQSDEIVALEATAGGG